jgi:NDP-sugar pyrophosphorylase family protein
MQIVIPMSGFGERFREAGYSIPKPLIQVDSKTIIQHVVEMFPGECDITFICNKEHLENTHYKMREILNRIAPNSNIVSINPHKLGPIHAVLKAMSYLDLSKPTIVNYADFTCDWSFKDFCKKVELLDCDGAIPCYRGFHPHTLWSNYYAYVPEIDNFATDIQEKQPFTENPREEFASSGTYYFKSAKIMQHYFKKCIEEDLTVGGEYYASMAYKPMIKDGLKIHVYELNHFMQWGTPADLEEYQYWSSTFEAILKESVPPLIEGALMIPMVGLGSRFKNEGYEIPKPLIKVSNKPMAIQALLDLPRTDVQKFIFRENMDRVDELKKELIYSSSNPKFTELNYMTDGQASTCIAGSNNLDLNKPITIAACDNGMIYDSKLLKSLMDSNKVDVIVWVARGYPGAIRSPKMYGWIDAEENGKIKSVSVKTPLSRPSTDPVVVGTFTFKKLNDFVISVKKMKNREGKVNGEYYVDSAINDAISLGLRCFIFEIDQYICWGTPNDLRTFEYWQSCFDGWDGHPYQKINDENTQ